jgi:glycosyltransferase involved in cell wall biosynthesis
MISCIIPACNEAGHLDNLIARITKLAKISEIIIVEGGSTDNSWLVAKELQNKFPNKVHAIKQRGKGKFNAVIEGSDKANEKILMIWDADATVRFESNIKLIDNASVNSFIMGDRLKGKKEKDSFRILNWIGNYFFAVLWAPILHFKVNDLFCGSKVFPKELMQNLDNNLLATDNYGDLTLIYAAKIQKIPIISIPVDYLTRTYGKTNMMRWSTARKFLVITLKVYKKTLRHDKKILS